MEESPPAKRPRDDDEQSLCFLAKKTVKGATTEFEITDLLPSDTVATLSERLANSEGCDSSQVTLVCKGKVLGDKAAALGTLADKAGPDGRIIVVFLVRKPAGADASATVSAAPPSAAPAAAATATAPAAATASSAPSAAATSPAAAAGQSAVAPVQAASNAGSAASSQVGRRILLLIRHGQCCHDDTSNDHMKALTVHGQHQAEASARFVAQLFATGILPATHMLLHSTSRRARETAARIPIHLQGIQVWNADLLRETDPKNNPLRAEEVFNRIFIPPPDGSSDCLVVVAHNNINLYLLMRAAGVPIERAAQAWSMFHLQHASITRIDVLSSGLRQVVSVGAAGHIPKDNVTWSNISGPDLVEWSGGGPERHKLSGRAILLIRQVVSSEQGGRQREVLAEHVKGLSEYMVSGNIKVLSTARAEPTAIAIAQKYKAGTNILPDSIDQEPEAAFLQFFCPPESHKRDTVALVAEDSCLIYCLLRALCMSPQEAQAARSLYRIGHASISIIQIKSDGPMRVVAVGDTGHLPIELLDRT